MVHALYTPNVRSMILALPAQHKHMHLLRKEMPFSMHTSAYKYKYKYLHMYELLSYLVGRCKSSRHHLWYTDFNVWLFLKSAVYSFMSI